MAYSGLYWLTDRGYCLGGGGCRHGYCLGASRVGIGVTAKGLITSHLTHNALTPFKSNQVFSRWRIAGVGIAFAAWALPIAWVVKIANKIVRTTIAASKRGITHELGLERIGVCNVVAIYASFGMVET